MIRAGHIAQHGPATRPAETTERHVQILVTGAAGFIGSHLCERLVDRGDAVVGIDNFDPLYDHRLKEENLAGILHDPQFAFFRTDLRDAAALGTWWQEHGGEFDAVVHLAARAGVRPSIEDPLGYEQANIAATMNLLERLVTYSHRPRLVFGSSSSVYGNKETVPFAESDPVDHPISPYAATKKACELICHTYHHLYNLPVFALRFFTVYGPRQRPDLAIHKFTARILRGESIDVFGDGTTSRDYTYIDDIIDGVVTAVDRCEGYEVINLGSHTPVTLSDMIAAIEAACGQDATINRLPVQPGDVDRTFADVGKAQCLLDYAPSMDFRQGVQNFVDWYRARLL
ncbi:MAG: GDP-mannose 4,6-dehydratase [Phycisphaerae bacterium]|nr:GDP-mannose 4,6-dehydratase [Phycisphaerae bacterium]